MAMTRTIVQRADALMSTGRASPLWISGGMTADAVFARAAAQEERTSEGTDFRIVGSNTALVWCRPG